MKKRTKKVQLKPEKDYISSRAEVVRNEIQDSIGKMRFSKQKTGYFRFILNIFKSQEKYVEREFLDIDDHKLLRSLNKKFKKLSTLYKLHKDKSLSFFSDLVAEYEEVLTKNILDDSVESDKRIRRIIDWFDDNLKCGFTEKKIKEKLTVECLKDIYDNNEAVDSIKETLITSSNI